MLNDFLLLFWTVTWAVLLGLWFPSGFDPCLAHLPYQLSLGIVALLNGLLAYILTAPWISPRLSPLPGSSAACYFVLFCLTVGSIN